MTLVWNELECGWECSDCGAIYGEEEVARMFDYNVQNVNTFNEGYCMDCGGRFTEVVVAEK